MCRSLNCHRANTWLTTTPLRKRRPRHPLEGSSWPTLSTSQKALSGLLTLRLCCLGSFVQRKSQSMSVWGSGFVPHSVSKAHASWHFWRFNLFIFHCCLIFHHGNAVLCLLLRMGTWLLSDWRLLWTEQCLSMHVLPSIGHVYSAWDCRWWVLCTLGFSSRCQRAHRGREFLLLPNLLKWSIVIICDF